MISGAWRSVASGTLGAPATVPARSPTRPPQQYRAVGGRAVAGAGAARRAERSKARIGA
jgi:hypothetical protein